MDDDHFVLNKRSICRPRLCYMRTAIGLERIQAKRRTYPLGMDSCARPAGGFENREREEVFARDSVRKKKEGLAS
jgi:hypothetical protein